MKQTIWTATAAVLLLLVAGSSALATGQPAGIDWSRFDRDVDAALDLAAEKADETTGADIYLKQMAKINQVYASRVTDFKRITDHGLQKRSRGFKCPNANKSSRP